MLDEEGIEFTKCLTYVPTPNGNIGNEDTRWDISGSLVKKISSTEEEIFCKDRTVLVPVRYRTFEDAMVVCEQLGEKGLYSLQSFLL